MLRILFDKNVPYIMRARLVGYYVRTADDEGCERISNGELIRCAEEAGYQIIVTCDQSIQYQQNMTRRKISMIVLGSNVWPAVEPKIPIAAALKRVSPGSFEFIEIAPPPKRRRLRNRST